MSVKILRHVLNWVEEQTYWIASRFLMLGFELDLYSPSEYCMVYWYLYVVLIKLAEKTHFRMAVSNEPSKFVSIFNVILLLRFVKYSCTSTQLNLAGLNS